MTQSLRTTKDENDFGGQASAAQINRSMENMDPKAEIFRQRSSTQSVLGANNRYDVPNTKHIMIEDDVENENKNSENRLD